MGPHWKGEKDLTRNGIGILTVSGLALVLGLNLWECSREPEQPQEAPLEKAERLLGKDDAAALQEARVALQEALTADPQAARVHYLLGTTFIREGKGEQNRDKLEELYSSAVTGLEKALELYGDAGVPVEVYQQLVDVYRNKALLPKRFNVERDIKAGVGPWEVKAMEKAVKIFDEARARFPDAPAFHADRAETLKQEVAELKALYVENVERVWLSRPSGFAQPDGYPP
jgi:tetratricopeptide (TPR) repeat protein